MKPSMLVPALSVIAALALAGCASDAPAANAPVSSGAPSAPAEAAEPAEPAKGDAASVDVRNIAFKPAEITVLKGTEVTWVNFDKDVAHTVTSGEGGDKGVPGVKDPAPSKPDGTFDGPLDAAGDEFAFTFEEKGEFAYFCEIHPSMRGVVIVE